MNRKQRRAAKAQVALKIIPPERTGWYTVHKDEGPSVVVAADAPPPDSLLAYAEVAAHVLPSRCSPDRCVNASWIFVEVMRRLGVAGAHALSVEVMAMNSAFYALEVATTAEEARHWEQQGASAVVIDGIPPTASHLGWAGHVVGIVDGWLVDSATSQLSRPARGIVLPEVLLAAASPQFVSGMDATTIGNSDGCVVRYRARPSDLGFEHLPGFSDHQGNLSVASQIEKLIRARRAG